LVIVAGLLAIAVGVGGAADWRALAAGVAAIPAKHPDMPAYELFSAIVFAGAGGTANLFYSFYLRDKGWGMGARVAKVANPLRGREEAGVEVGCLPPESAETVRRWRAWFAHVQRDQVLFFWLLNTLTILLFVFGALAVLHRGGLVPDQERLVWDEAALLGRLWGPAGRWLFLVIGVATLFTTQLTLVDGVARSIADIVHTAWPAARRRPLGWWYGVAAASWMVLGCALTYWYERLPALLFLLSAGFFGGVAMAIYCPLTLVLNRRLLPPPLRPGRVRQAVLLAIGVFYACFAVVATGVVVRRVLAG
jgi:hypothetical protein